MSAQDIPVPDLGEFDDVEIIEVHVKAGDSVAAEDPTVVSGPRAPGVQEACVVARQRGHPNGLEDAEGCFDNTRGLPVVEGPVAASRRRPNLREKRGGAIVRSARATWWHETIRWSGPC